MCELMVSKNETSELRSRIDKYHDSLNVKNALEKLTIPFQSLIGTVQQQCLLRFMFSLYLISTVFQSFSPKKSVNLFIENSRKALILLAFLFLSKLARRFTAFFTEFLAISCLNVQL